MEDWNRDTERRCPWCNVYRRRKWTRRHEFKSWIKLIAFHIALIPLGKVRIKLFSLQLWVNNRVDLVLQPWWGNESRRRKNSEFKPKTPLKIDFVSYPARAEVLVNMDRDRERDRMKDRERERERERASCVQSAQLDNNNDDGLFKSYFASRRI